MMFSKCVYENCFVVYYNMEIFPEQKTMNRNDIVLIAGDFGGIWAQTEPHPLRPERDRQKVLKNENYRLDWLQEKNCTFCYVLGNHALGIA